VFISVLFLNGFDPSNFWVVRVVLNFTSSFRKPQFITEPPFEPSGEIISLYTFDLEVAWRKAKQLCASFKPGDENEKLQEKSSDDEIVCFCFFVKILCTFLVEICRHKSCWVCVFLYYLFVFLMFMFFDV